MPLEFTKITGQGQIIGLWRIERQKIVGSTGVAVAQKSYESSHTEACRELIKVITGNDNLQIDKDSFGKPFIKNKKSFISFSHSGDFAAAVYNKDSSVGIDLQLRRDKIISLATKFCSAEELEYTTLGKQLEYLHVIWGAKEAMFKQYGKGAVLFKEHIFVHPFDLKDAGDITVSFKKPGAEQTVSFHYECNEDYFLVYTAAHL